MSSSVDKKRARDRRAQQNLRDKRAQYIRVLESQVQLCRELHGTPHTRGNDEALRALQEENAVLKARQQSLRALVQTWDTDADEPSPCPRGPNAHPQKSLECDHRATQPNETDGPSNQGYSIDASIDLGWPNIDLRASASILRSGSLPLDDWHVASAGSHAARVQQPSTSPSSSMLSLSPSWPTIGSLDLFTQVETAAAATSTSRAEVNNTNKAITPIPSLVDYAQVHLTTQVVAAEASSIIVEQNASGQDGIRLRKSAPRALPTGSRSFHPARLVPRTRCADFEEASIGWAWEAHAAASLVSPDTPSPLDLLYDTRQNPLANSIRRALKVCPCRDPEKLAIGWLAYLFVKWRGQPTAERFERLPLFMKLALAPRSLPLVGFQDVLLWSRLRQNIRNQDTYDVDEVLRTFARCLRVRWTLRDEILTERENRLVMRREFLNQIMNEDGWGLTMDFVTQYPELVQGLDRQTIIISRIC
ncbi:hypothetical protein S40288_03085 [Stachybotrys chartarum IBT 40288]|nr:hypothetical protein S40288_03085 [Stachybotrys chartarum IBT 40288]